MDAKAQLREAVKACLNEDLSPKEIATVIRDALEEGLGVEVNVGIIV